MTITTTEGGKMEFSVSEHMRRANPPRIKGVLKNAGARRVVKAGDNRDGGRSEFTVGVQSG